MYVCIVYKLILLYPNMLGTFIQFTYNGCRTFYVVHSAYNSQVLYKYIDYDSYMCICYVDMSNIKDISNNAKCRRHRENTFL